MRLLVVWLLVLLWWPFLVHAQLAAFVCVVAVAGAVAGAGAVGRIIAGVALLAIGFLVPGIGALGVKILIGVGASLVLGGVAQLLTPVPQMPTGANTDQDPRKSYSFSGIQQTSRQGVPVPIVYGETLVGSVVISAGIDTVQVNG